MKSIDDKIREALHAEDADLFREYGGEQSVMQMVGDTFRGRQRWLTVLAFVYMFAFLGLLVWMLIEFFNAETVELQLRWGLGSGACLLFHAMLKMWYWMQLNRNAVLREVKRVELQIARLAARSRDQE